MMNKTVLCKIQIFAFYGMVILPACITGQENGEAIIEKLSKNYIEEIDSQTLKTEPHRTEITGGFGYKLGETYNVIFNKYTIGQEGRVSLNYDYFKVPLRRASIPGFNEILIAVSPKSKRIAEINAYERWPEPANKYETVDNDDEIDKVQKTIELKYGKPTSIGNNDISWEIGNRSIHLAAMYQMLVQNGKIIVSSAQADPPRTRNAMFIKILYFDQSIDCQQEMAEIEDSITESLKNINTKKKNNELDKFKTNMGEYNY